VISIVSKLRRAAPLFLLLALLALLLTGCETDTPQNTFDAKGEVAEDQRNLFYLAMWPALVIMVLVGLAIVVAVLRFRERDPNAPPPKQTHGNTRLEIMWTIAPAILLLGLGVPMVIQIYDLDNLPDPDDAYVIDVVGQRFSWEFQYPEEEPDENGAVLSVFDNQPHMPAGEKVIFRLRSVDVIHSFWIPKLGGKRDAMPCNLLPPAEGEEIDPLADPNCEGGTLNKLWLKADEPGSYSGQCAEYCGLNHALMTLVMHADEREDFDAWVEEARSGGGGGGDDDGPSGGSGGDDEEPGDGDGEPEEPAEPENGEDTDAQGEEDGEDNTDEDEEGN
jgi:cytochrome c oxidase subunit 2